MRTRTANIEDFNKHRRSTNNPLFDLLTSAFDHELLEMSRTKEYVLNNLFIDTRTDERIVREKLFDLWKTSPRNVDKTEVLHSHTNGASGFTYLLLGKKGTGKSITLNRFSSDITLEANDNTHIIFLDLITKKSDQAFLEQLPNSLIEEIYDSIKEGRHPQNGDLTAYLIDMPKMRQLDEAYTYLADADVAKYVLENKAETIAKLFQLLSFDHETYLIIDNVDDFPLQHIKIIIDKCVDLMQNYKLKCIVALREYWNPQNLDIDDQNICSFYLTKPDILKILMKRLELIPIENVKKKYEIQYGKHTLDIKPEDIIDTFKRIMTYIVENDRVHHELYELANHDIREHFFNIYNFFHSPYLYAKPMFVQVLIDKLAELAKADGHSVPLNVRKPRFFDFLECAMAIHSLCYDEQASRIFNIFFHKVSRPDRDYNYENTLIFIRIMQCVSGIAEDKEQVLSILEKIGYSKERLCKAIDVLFKNALIESVQGNQLEHAQEISLSAKGKIYLSKLIYEYVYLLYVSDAVPMPDQYKEDIVEKFGGKDDFPIVQRGTLQIKHRSVHKFIEFISEEENREKSHCPSDFHSLLDRIRGEGGIAQKMAAHAEHTMNIMTNAGSTYSKKIDNVTVVPRSMRGEQND